MRSNYSRSVCETQNSMTINIHDVCNGIYTIIPCLCPCLGDARQPALLSEYLYVSIINLFSLWRLRGEQAAATRRQHKRVRCNILCCFGSDGTICWCCMAFLHYRSPSPLSIVSIFIFFFVLAAQHRFVSILFDCWMLFHPSPTRFSLFFLVFYFYLAFV